MERPKPQAASLKPTTSQTDAEGPKLYSEFVSRFPLVNAPEEDAEDAALYERLLRVACERPANTMLERGSGGGNNASHLKSHFQLTLVDRSSDMLEVSRALHPECADVQGDMRTV